MASDLPALIARVEAATGPDREIDQAIAVYQKNANRPADKPRVIGVANAWDYTASLDAAVSLVPSGWDWCISKGWGEAAIASLAPAEKVAEVTTEAATPALALCAAALRARQAMEGGDHG
jgi:hypothetical protein